MHVYTLNTSLGDTKNDLSGALFKVLTAMEPLRHGKSYYLVGPYRYPGKGTSIIPDAIWDRYRAFKSVHVFSGKHWKLEKQLYFVDDKHSMVKSKTVTLKLHEPNFPLELMLRVSPDIRTHLKLERST
jgi:hypothetical protein